MKKKTMIATLLLGGIILLAGCSKVSLTNSNTDITPNGDAPGGAPSDMTPPDDQAPIDDSQLPPTPPSEN